MVRILTAIVATLAAACMAACGGGSSQPESPLTDPAVVEQGKSIFRFDTFGDETQWTDTLRMHEVIRTAVDPTTALSVGIESRCRSTARGGRAGNPRRQYRSEKPRYHRRAIEARRGGGPQGHRRNDQRHGHADARWHYVRAMSFDRRRFLCATASANASMAGPIAISIRVPSLRCRRP